MSEEPQEQNIVMRYFTFAWQLIAGLGLSVYLGIVIDKWLHTSLPLAVWILPLLVLTGMMIKVIQDTSTKK